MIYSSTASSPAIGGTGPIPDIPRTIHLNGAGPMQPPPPKEANGHDQPASIGHNSKGAQMPKDESGKAPAWATPSKLSLDEAAKALIGPGRYAQERRALIEAIFDPRLGIAPLPLQLLAAVVECINGKTGTAHPGGRYWAQRIVNYLNGLPTQYREGALKNAVTAVRQAGYAVSEKRAAEKGGRAIAHFAITCPTPEEKQAGIEAYLQEKQDLPSSEVTQGMTSACGHSGDDLSCGHPADDLRPGCGHPGSEAVVTLGVKKRGPLSITEPDNINPKTLSGAEAPGAVDTTLFSDRAPPPSKGAGWKPPTDAEIEVGFRDWYAAYPRKKKPDDAKRAYVKRVKARKVEDRATIPQLLAAVKAYEFRTDLNFVEYPASWLNGGEWRSAAPVDTPATPDFEPNWFRDNPAACRAIGAAGWGFLIKRHAANGTWNHELLGPPPGEPGCVIPRDFLHDLSGLLAKLDHKKGSQ